MTNPRDDQVEAFVAPLERVHRPSADRDVLEHALDRELVVPVCKEIGAKIGNLSGRREHVGVGTPNAVQGGDVRDIVTDWTGCTRQPVEGNTVP